MVKGAFSGKKTHGNARGSGNRSWQANPVMPAGNRTVPGASMPGEGCGSIVADAPVQGSDSTRTKNLLEENIYIITIIEAGSEV